MDSKIKFGYWYVRGAGQVCRLVLAYSGLQWENIKYMTKEAWFQKEKKELGLVFPNLPYLIDGDFKLTESRAINLYVIMKSGKTDLLGKSIEDKARVQSIIGVVADIRAAMLPLIFESDQLKNLPNLIQKVGPKFEELAKFIGDRPFALGYLTLADFYLSEISHYAENVTPELYAKHSFFENIRKNFNELPEIKAYYQTETAVKEPFFPPYAAIKF